MKLLGTGPRDTETVYFASCCNYTDFGERHDRRQHSVDESFSILSAGLAKLITTPVSDYFQVSDPVTAKIPFFRNLDTIEDSILKFMFQIRLFFFSAIIVYTVIECQIIRRNIQNSIQNALDTVFYTENRFQKKMARIFFFLYFTLLLSAQP